MADENADLELQPMDTSEGEGEETPTAGKQEDDRIGLNDLQGALSSVAEKWYALGLQLDLSAAELHAIESETGKESSYYLNGMLKLWVEKENPKPSWEVVIKALRHIEATELANSLQEKFGISKEEEEAGAGISKEEEEAESQVPDYKTQNQELHAVLQQRLKKGDTWFLLDVKWLKQWKKYVGYDTWDQYHAGQQSANPGPIDNANLFKDPNSDALKEHLMEELDYGLLPEAAWNKLIAWYGLSQGSRPIARKVVEHGLYMKHCKVEVYLLEFKLYLHPKTSETVFKSFSRANTIADLEEELRSTFDVSKDAECRVWHRYMTSSYELLSNLNETLQDAGLYNGQTIVLEQKNKDGHWPRTTEKNSYGNTRSTDGFTSSSYGSTGSTHSSSSSSSYFYSGWGAHQKPTAPGLCGLNNLGNTCFMNSALQCLSNTQPLTEYFLGTAAGYKPYMKHMNRSNPLGMGGAIAESYGALLEEVWSGKCSCVAPRHFKTQVGRYAPTFVGYAQHDSQELLAFLLDGLHEDLNLVLEKPYVDMTVKTEGRDDTDVAEESWHKYLQRNQSVIVRVFQGQLKSTLICPKCNMVSKIFDPFMFLSLPLPIKKTRTLLVNLVRANPDREVYRFKLKVPKRGCVADIKNELSKFTDIPTDLMVVVDVYNGRFHRIYADRESLSHILDRDDIYIYELTHSLNNPDWVHVPVYHREEIVRDVKYSYQSYSQRYHQLFGLPLVVRVPRADCTYRHLYSTIMTWCRRYVRTWSEAKAVDDDMSGGPDKDDPMQSSEDGNHGNSSQNEPQSDEEAAKDNNAPANSTSTTNNCTAEGSEEEHEKENKKKENEENEGEEKEENEENEGKEKEENEEEEKEKEEEPDLFRLVVVNSYGSQEVQRLKDDSKSPLKLSGQTYIACEWQTDVKDKCYDLNVAQLVRDHESCNDIEQESKRSIQLGDCMKLFTEKERLSKDDAWYCPGCKDFVQASKKFDLWKLPEILVIHLKRFSYDRYWRDKLDALVEFPVNGLDLTEYCQNPDDPEPVYNLFAVSNHFGGMGGGHYTAYCKNKDTGKWYNFDDSHVSEASESHLVTAAAYVLFYRRHTEGIRTHILDRSLSQSFVEEGRALKAKYHPSTNAASDEEEMECDRESQERKRSRNESGSADDVFAPPPSGSSTSNLEEPD